MVVTYVDDELESLVPLSGIQSGILYSSSLLTSQNIVPFSNMTMLYVVGQCTHHASEVGTIHLVNHTALWWWSIEWINKV